MTEQELDRLSQIFLRNCVENVPQELDRLSQIFLRSCVENVPLWKEIGISLPIINGNLGFLTNFRVWRDQDYRGQNMKVIRKAEIYLNEMGYQTLTIKSATPTTVAVKVANAGSFRLCVRIPKDLVQRILVLEFVPKISPAR